MHGLFVYGILSLGVIGTARTDGEKGPVWLKDYGQACEKALRESKPIFVVFR
jgi:hypothetical protein